MALVIAIAACGGRGHARHAPLANLVDAGPPFVPPAPETLRCYLTSDDQPQRCHDRGCDVGPPLMCGHGFVTGPEMETRRQLEALKNVPCTCVCEADRRACAAEP